ncbi:MAG: hypothetical protein AVDCRST_MAG56-8068, partial [uncultured Cytophagales bacterium]
ERLPHCRFGYVAVPAGLHDKPARGRTGPPHCNGLRAGPLDGALDGAQRAHQGRTQRPHLRRRILVRRPGLAAVGGQSGRIPV